MNTKIVKPKLITKISTVILFILVFVQVLQIMQFEFFLKEHYQKNSQSKFEEAIRYVATDFKQKEDSLNKKLKDLGKNESLLASLYFVNNYQDKDNYNAILVDEEKKRILDELLDSVKISGNSIGALYDIDKNLVAYVEQTPKGYKQNFISYIDGKEVIFSKYDTQSEYILDINTMDNKYIDKTYQEAQNTPAHYYFINQKLLIKAYENLSENDHLIGYAKMIKVYEKEYIDQISKYLKMALSLKEYNNKKSGLSDLFDPKQSVSLQKNGDRLFTSRSIDTESGLVELRFDLDAHELEHQISENRKQVLLNILVIFIITLLLFRFFLDKILITPLELLMEQIELIKKSNTPQFQIIKTNDELEEISKSLKQLALVIDEREQEIIEQYKENQKNEKLLAEQSKMVSMGEMIGNIAHQWRQPLSVISASSTGVLFYSEMGTLTDEIVKKHMNSINENAQYLSKTIDDFKNFIKGERVKTHFLVNNALNSFFHLVEGSVKSNNISVVFNVDDTLGIDGYENELLQCWINIFNNAKDAFKENNIEERYLFIDGYKTDHNTVMITFKDNAGGIPEDIIKRIFEPYFTTKHKSQGTGLGLHMTYNLIVDGMKGSIIAQNITYQHKSITLKGAKFTIELPIS